MKRRKNKQRGPVRAKKVICDGITFASGLEKYMYKVLKKAKIKAEYEGCTYAVSYTHLRAHETPEHLVFRVEL